MAKPHESTNIAVKKTENLNQQSSLRTAHICVINCAQVSYTTLLIVSILWNIRRCLLERGM